MSIYVSKNVGRGVRVGSRVPSMGSFVHGIFSILMVVFLIANWKLAVGLVALWIIVGVSWEIFKENANMNAKAKKQLQKHLHMIQNGKTLLTRQNNCIKAIELAEGRDKALTAKLKALDKTLPIEDIIEKAKRAEFKGQQKKALDSYLDAIYKCQEEGIKDADFKLAQYENISIHHIEEKARNLGWKQA